MSEIRTFDFFGQRGGIGSTTWGQRGQWATVEANRPHHGRFVLRLLCEIPDSVTIDEVVAAVRRLVNRYEALRTMFVRGADRWPSQSVAQAGSMSIEVISTDQADTWAVAQETADRLAYEPFEVTDEWPVRMGLVVRGGHPSWFCAALSHLVVDATAVRILERELSKLLAGLPDADLVSVGEQPLDRAVYEQSAQGQAALGNTLDSWVSGFRKAPRSLFRTAPDLGRPGPRYPHLILYAKGLGRCAREVSQRHNVGPSAVYCAAAVAALTAASAVDSCGLIVTCSNRAVANNRDYVGTIAQQGLVPVDAVGRSFYDLLQRMWPKLLMTYRTSSYDPAELDRLFPEDTATRGTSIDHFVNFVESPAIWLPREAADQADNESRCIPGPPVPSTQLLFGLVMSADRADAALRMFADNRYVSVDKIRSVLGSIDDTIRTAAEVDVELPIRLHRAAKAT